MYKYTVQFEYGGDEDPHTFPLPLNCDLSEKKDSNILFVVVEIEEYIKDKNLHGEHKFVHDVILFDENGNILWSIEDLPEYHRRQDETIKLIMKCK